MPVVNKHRIDILTPLEAYQGGKMTHPEYIVSRDWVSQKHAIRHSKRNVYIDGVYRGVTDVRTPLHQVVEKFKKHIF